MPHDTDEVYVFPCSHAQAGLWLADRLDPGSSAYTVPAALRLRGDLDAVALRQSLQDMVDRHEVLRTTFRSGADGPEQVVHSYQRIRFDEVALEGDAEREVRRLAGIEAAHRFDLTEGPLLRATLLRVAEREHVLLLTMHHIVADGWSVGVMLAELGAGYVARRTGVKADLPELPFQYADYSVWHRDQLAGGLMDEQLAHWRQRFATPPPALELPWDRPRPVEPTHRGHRAVTWLDADLRAGLEALALAHRASLFMVLAAGFTAVLHRHARQSEVVLGTPLANRSRAEALIGYFVNVLPIRTATDGDPTFAELLDRVRDEALSALGHADVPFDRLLDAVRPDRGSARTPLFQAMIALQNAYTEPIALPGLDVELLEVDPGSAKYDVNLLVEQRGDRLHAALEVNADVLARETAARMLDQLAALLAAAVAEPGTRLADLPMGAPVPALVTETGAVAGPSALELFHRQVERTPHAVAVRDRYGVATYAEVAAEADRIAAALHARGVGPDSLVALRVERARAMVAAVLGVWRVGAAYVPVDPYLPAARREQVLAAADPVIVLTTPALAVGDPDELLLTGLPTGALPVLDDSDRPAYVLFTSGSTGSPKGVLVPHSGLSRYVGWAVEEYGVGTGGSPVHSSLGFDLTITSLLLPLTRGGPVVLLDDADGVHQLGALLAQEGGFDLVKITPAHLEVLLRTVPADRLRAAAKVFVVGGEALSPDLVRRFRALAPDVRVVNEFGPTETVVGCCVHEVVAEDADAVTVPIGSPVPGTRLHVLDDRLRPAPDGVPGELCVAGPQVGWGYLDAPAQTATRFVPDPWGPPGSRMYLTGDLARVLPSGALEFLGRVDRQVKVRGYRVEPGEVEAVLRSHPAVADAVVTAPDGLVGYVVLTAAATGAALRGHLADRLPDYLVPGAVVVLDELPLTVNGKVDRARLPAPGDADYTRAVLEEPRPGTERDLAALWREVLGRYSVGRADDFFALGGHSLSATRMASRISDRFGVEVPLRRLFDQRTLTAQAAWIDTAERQSTSDESSVDGPALLSFAQQRLWFLDQLDPGSPLYTVPAALRLRGPLDVDAVRAAVRGLVARHDGLRTSFRTDADGEVVQVVAETSPVDVDLVDLSAFPDTEARCADLVARRARTGFDLAVGPLLRVDLLRLADRDHVLVVTVHHIVSDAWSVGVLLRDFAALYRSSGDLPALRTTLTRHAARQRRQLDGGALDEQIAYWRDRLAGPLPVLALAGDRRTGGGVRPGLQITGDLPSDLTAGVERVARDLGVTPFAVLLAAFYAVLHRHTAQTDLLVGSPVANRVSSDLEDLVGCFVNVLVLRGRVDPAATFAALVRQAAETSLAAQANQDVPFERLVEEVGDAGGDHTPLFQAMFGLQNVPRSGWDALGLDVEELPADTGTARFDVTLLVEPHGTDLGLRLECAADLFDEAAAHRFLATYRTLLAAAVARPDSGIGALPVLDPAERRRLIIDFNATDVEFPTDRTFADLFADRVARHPDAVAVHDPAGTLTYGDLAERADLIAARLLDAGARPGVPVALLAERGRGFLAAVLAVFRAGLAYVPLERLHPVARLAGILTASGATVLVHDDETVALAADLADRTSAVPVPVYGPGAAVPVVSTGPRDLAYVIFTSGSTGVPKGAMVEQEGMVNHLFGKVRDLAFTADDVLVQNAPVSFDISVWQFLTPLLVGGRVLVVSDEQARTPRLLWQTATDHGATVLEVVPSMLRASLAEPDLPVPPGLRLLVLTGEALPPDLVRDWLARHPGIPVVNAYGPTECSDDVTHAVLAEPPALGDAFTPIGVPLPNTRLYVLDAAGRPVPAGVPGELHVGGTGVGRGYLGDPVRTAASFVPDPFGPVPGRRLYRTGDLVRLRSDGSLEFLGRIDHQVKVRGHRVELGEVEAALRDHPAVDDCAVVSMVDSEGEAELAGYFTAERPPSSRDLRARLGRVLPSYMIPAHLVHLEALPLNDNGKVDRSALPAPVRGSAPDVVRTAPRTELERVVAHAWADVLGVAEIGAEDDFFGIGGHSLLAVRVLTRLRSELGREIELRLLFEHPVLEDLAAALDDAPTAAYEPIPVIERGDLVELSYAQRRMWFFEQLNPGTAVFSMPAAYRVHGSLDVDRLAAALTAAVERHDVLRTGYLDREGTPWGRVFPAAPVVVPVTDLRGHPDPDRRVADLARAESERPFDLAVGPMLRAEVLRLSEVDWVLLVTVHHLAADGGSAVVLLSEVLAEYAGRVPDRPEVRYADFALWQRDLVEGSQGQVDHWRDRLAGDLPVLRLPADRPRRDRAAHQGELVTTVLPAELVDRLRAVGEGATLFMVLLAGFQVLLHRLTGERDVVVGTPVDGRSHQQVRRLVGCFVNTLPIRTDVDPAASVRDLVRRVRATAVDAYANQDVPFERIVSEVLSGRSDDTSPLFQVLFNMVDPTDPIADLPVPGLRFTPLDSRLLRFGAKFDLTLYARDLGAGGLDLNAVYDGALFDRDRMTGLLDQLTTVLEAFAADPEQAVEAIVLRRDPIELPEQAPRWAGDVAERLARQAAATPDALAATDADGSHTYAELDRAVDDVAGALAARGVGPGAVVAVHAHRRVTTVTALLGVLRAGAAFVLLDPAYPVAALAERLALASATVVLGSAAQPPPADLAVDPVLLPCAPQPARTPVPADPDRVAYLSFTSGTTGAPRLVAATARPLAHFLDWHVSRWGLGAGDRVSALSGVAHDPFLRDVLTGVWCGGSVHLPSTATVRDPDALADWLAERDVTVAHLTPSLARLLASADASRALPSLRHAFLGGEALTGADRAALARRAPGVRCVNVYGATETPQAVAYHEVGDEHPDAVVPLGEGIDGVQLLVLRGAVPAAVGELGEIVVRTPYLSLGYPLDPDLTAERFVDGGYRTGDLGRYRPDGLVEYAGRADRQAQVRGHRVEPAEVEAVLRGRSGVDRVHVEVVGDRLTAYVVGSATGLEEWAAARLPEQLVPAVVVLDELPLTPNGKVDRAALTAGPRAVVAPRTDAEHVLHAIWLDVLPGGDFGVEDDFFAVGGHSLAAAQVLARTRREFAVDLGLGDVLGATTIAALAEVVETAVTAQLDDLTDAEIAALLAEDTTP